MKCPLCNTEMRITATDYVVNNGNLFTRQILTCRNKNCQNFGKEVKTIYTPMVVSEDNNAEVTSTE
ncbi:hypothetical protein [Butyrivibrio sp. AE2032]|uniref:hypothetical protein n=1 Tax=Butyrivibrio sp. AE2032 TaxID=1458463 RepID=UPI00054F59F1|nr:hypothetical protein [Butyrivibrio sp. AE2032]